MPPTQQATRSPATTVFTPVSDASAREARRSFTDSAGRYWRVEERSAPAVGWARGPRYLLFDAATIARRVSTVPSN